MTSSREYTAFSSAGHLSTATVLFALGALLLPNEARSQGPQMGICVAAGYVSTGRTGDTPPASVDGGAFGLNLDFFLNDMWGIRLEGNFDVHAPYVIYEIGELPDTEEGETKVGFVEGATVEPSFASSAAVSALYIVDVMRLRPVLGLGVVGLRTDQKWNDAPQSGHVIGMRISLGADYLILDYLGLGAVLHNDIFFIGSSDFDGRLQIMAQVSFFFDFRNFGDGEQPG